MDLKKAFDCLHYSALHKILSNIGIIGTAHSLIMNYLTNRKQFVSCDGKDSELQDISFGIPQGSVLGPLLFNIYANGIFDLNLNGQIQLFADDTALIYGERDFNTLKRKMTEDITRLSSWLSNLNLHINFEKTKFIIFKLNTSNYRNAFYSIKIGQNTILATNNYCYLGLEIDNLMSWSLHIETVCNKISKYVFLLKRLRFTLNKSTLFMFYHAFIYSRILYMLPIWGQAAKTHISCVQYLQNKAIKFINFLHPLTATNSLYSEPILSIHQLYIFESIFLIFKMKNNFIRTNFPLIPNFQVTGRNTRTSSHIRLPPYRSRIAQKSIFYNGISLFNSLPDSIKLVTGIAEFKKLARSHVATTYPIVN